MSAVLYFNCDLEFFFFSISFLVSYISCPLPQISLLCNSSVDNKFHLFIFVDSFAACKMLFLNYVGFFFVFKQELKRESPPEYKTEFLLSVLYLYSSLCQLFFNLSFLKFSFLFSPLFELKVIVPFFLLKYVILILHCKSSSFVCFLERCSKFCYVAA